MLSNTYLLTVLLVSCLPSTTKKTAGITHIEDTKTEDSAAREEDSAEESIQDSGETSACDQELGQEMDLSITEDFSIWLSTNGYDASKIARTDLTGGSFGGMISTQDCVTKEPVIFIHGNSDQALLGSFGGWEESRGYFLSQGYRSAELYATTYGFPQSNPSSDYSHDKESLLQVRTFIEAVLEYTQADKIDIIAHSLGVTMSRRAILGGEENDSDGSTYDIGEPLSDKIDSFVGIAGANQGLSSCAYPGINTPVCDNILGLYPGLWSGFEVVGQSHIIETINSQSRYEGAFIYSLWTNNDLILGPSCLVWGINSCKIPEQDDEYSNPLLNHFSLKTESTEVQYAMVVTHTIP